MSKMLLRRSLTSTRKSKSKSTRIPPPRPPPEDTWVVDEKMIVQGASLVPVSPECIDGFIMQRFLQNAFKNNEWEDWDLVAYELGNALKVFPESSQFADVKWVLVSSSISLSEICLTNYISTM